MLTNLSNLETKVKLLARHIHQSTIPGDLLCTRHCAGRWGCTVRVTAKADQASRPFIAFSPWLCPGCALAGWLCTVHGGTALTFIFIELLIKRWGENYMSILNTPFI